MQHPPGFLRQVQYTTDAVPAQSFAAKLRVENRGGLCYYPIVQKTAPVRMFGRQKTMPDIYIIGDSTVEDNTPPFRGWGWALKDLTAPGVGVKNHALSGRSSKSFLDEGLFEPVRKGMREGDLLLIQFGHNDEKDDAERHTDPETTFIAHLNRYCDAAVRSGAQPVLITPVSRRFFAGPDSVLYTHGEYAPAVRQLAKWRCLPLLDLENASRELYLALGEEKTAELFVRLKPGEHPDFPDGHDDKTHFNETGARRMAELVAGMMRADPRTAPFVTPYDRA